MTHVAVHLGYMYGILNFLTDGDTLIGSMHTDGKASRFFMELLHVLDLSYTTSKCKASAQPQVLQVESTGHVLIM